MKKTNKILAILGGLSLGIAAIGIGVISTPKEAKATDGVTATFDFTGSYVSGQAAYDLKANGSITNGQIKLSADAVGSIGAYSNPVRFYANLGLSFNGVETSSGSTVTSVSAITSLVITCSSNAYAKVFANTSTWTNATTTAISDTDTTTTAVNVTPSSTSFSVKLNAQSRVSKIVATYNTTQTTVEPVTSIALSSTSGTLAAGLSTTITPTILPSTANQNVTATSANTSVATVTVNADHTIKITAVAAGSTTITVSTVGLDASSAVKSATYALTVRDFAWSDLRTNYVFNTETVNSTVTLTGVVTKIIAGASFALQSGNQGVYGFSYNAVTNIAVGNYVSVKGTVSSYNGLIELSSPVATILTGTAPSVTTTTVTESMIANYANTPAATAKGLTGLDSTLVSVSGIKFAAALSATQATAISGTANVGAASIGIYANKNDVSATTTTALKTFLEKAGAVADDVVFTGVLGWNSNLPQLDLTNASELSSAEVTAVDNFVATYVNITAGTCAERWAAAKAAYASLTSVEKSMFTTCTGYADMKARYNAWAAANSDTGATASSVALNNDASNSTWIIATLSILAAATTVGFFLRKKKHV